jgi:hypothetical protein
MAEHVTIVAEVLAATGDAVLVHDGRGQPMWLPTVLAVVTPLGEPQARRPELSETDYVEVSMSPDLAATVGLR